MCVYRASAIVAKEGLKTGEDEAKQALQPTASGKVWCVLQGRAQQQLDLALRQAGAGRRHCN